MGALTKVSQFSTELHYKGRIFSIFVALTPEDIDAMKGDVDKAVDSGHEVFFGHSKSSAVDWINERTGIPPKILRYRLMYYDWQKSLDMGFDASSKSPFKEAV